MLSTHEQELSSVDAESISVIVKHLWEWIDSATTTIDK